MDTNKLEISGRGEGNDHAPSATYKQIPEEDVEDQVLSRPKSLSKSDGIKYADGADEKMLPDSDGKFVPEVKFTSEKLNGDSKLDIGTVKSEFVGMTREQLMEYANDPFWVRLRWALFVIFWLLWAGMLLAAILIIVGAPKCTPPEPKTWWEEGPLMEINDIDIKESELNDYQTSGIKGFIVTYPEDTYKPLNSSSSFMQFLEATKKNKFNVIVELTPGFTDLWFNQSESKEGEYEDYYIWHPKENAGDDKMPNNWLARESNEDKKIPAWKYSAIRKQFYYVLDSKPQLNFRSANVIEHFSKVLDSFLKAGVQGIRLRFAPNLLVDEKFTDEDQVPKPSEYTHSNYNFYQHTRTEHNEGLAPLLKQWKNIVKNKTENGVFMLAEDLTAIEAYKINETYVVDLPRYSKVFEDQITTAAKFKDHLDVLTKMFENTWPLWEVKNTDLPLDVLYPIAYLLKGSTILNSNAVLIPEILEIRKSPSVIFGTQDLYTVANKTAFAYVRIHSGNPGYVVAFNPSEDSVIVDFPSEIPKISDEVTVQYLSQSYNTTDITLRVKKDAHKFELLPKSSVVLSYVPKKEE